ncbi:MAG: transposase [Planctomycetaceae bacterium]|nr:transposase [Planctomycetaceae bacterium]
MSLEPISWALSEFGDCQLGDARRTRRLVKVGAQMLARPDGTSPEQTESWADCKALYRLMDCEDVSFEGITTPHFQRTRASGEPGQVRLILNDTTEINYGQKRRARGLGPVGQNTGRGFFLHSALMRDPNSEEVIGLAGQEIYYRAERPRSVKKVIVGPVVPA